MGSSRVRSGVAAIAVLVGLACHPGEPANLVLISVDTLRADHTSAYGYERDTTPTLSALAREGALFEQAYSATASTGPSHATLFTGAHVLRHGVIKNGLSLPQDNETLAEVLRERGYQTGAVVGSFVLDPKFAFDQGFDAYDATFRDAPSTPGRWQGHALEKFERRGGETTDVALEWLGGLDATRPFFLFVHYFDPHLAYDPPDDWLHRFGDHVRRFDAAHAGLRYDAEIAYTDAQIARLLEAVAARAPVERTLVVVTGDHGEGLGDHGVPGHAATIYEEAVRVPLVLRWPGTIAAGLRIRAPVGAVDVAPSLLDLLGQRAPAGAQGTSHASALRGGRPPSDERPIFLVRRHYRPGHVGVVPVKGFQFGVRTGRWKWIEDVGLGTRELYDLEADPGETTNRAGERAEEGARLAAMLSDWRDRSQGELARRAIAEDDRRALEALGYVE